MGRLRDASHLKTRLPSYIHGLSLPENLYMMAQQCTYLIHATTLAAGCTHIDVHTGGCGHVRQALRELSVARCT